MDGLVEDERKDNYTLFFFNLANLHHMLALSWLPLTGWMSFLILHNLAVHVLYDHIINSETVFKQNCATFIQSAATSLVQIGQIKKNRV